MSFILFDDQSSTTLRPLTFTRPVGAIRIGILTVAEKWGKRLNLPFSYRTAEYLQGLFPPDLNASLYINGSVCPDEPLTAAVLQLAPGEVLVSGDLVLAAFTGGGPFSPGEEAGLRKVKYAAPFTHLRYPEDVFAFNDQELRKDFALLTMGRSSAEVGPTNTIIGDAFFAEEGASAICATFNTLTGPVYLAKNAEVWEGSHIRGPFSLGEHSQVKMGSKIYGATTIGPQCRVGGEINNSVLFAYSSKGHEGFLGQSVLGEWCNIGADTNSSNLKNNYSEVSLWDYATQSYRKTGLQFCGLIMGDHAKCGINTMFNTGTVAGVGASIFGSGYQDKFIPGFSWAKANEGKYELDKFFETTAKVFERRNHKLTEGEKVMLAHVYAM